MPQPLLQFDDLIATFQDTNIKTFLMGQSRPLFTFYFRPFLITISIIQIEKKHKRCAWDLNPWLQDGRQRQNHGAMAVFLLFGISFKRFVAAAISRF